MESIEDVRALFESLQRDYPYLHMELEADPNPYCPLSMTIPRQTQNSFEMSIWHTNGDELCIGAGDSFCLEWFPMSKPDIVEDFTDTVHRLLSGENRIVEYLRADRVVVKADLQRPEGDRWKTRGSWSMLTWAAVFGARFHWGLKQRVLRNELASSASPRQQDC